MFNQLRAVSTSLYVTACLALTSALTFSLTTTAWAAPNVPCNDFLAKPASAATDPVAGAFIGLKPVAFVLGLVLFLLGAIFAWLDFGRKLLRGAMMIGGALLGFGAIVAFAGSLGLNAGC